MRRVIQLTAGSDAYTSCFANALRHVGVDVVNGGWSGRWLLKTCGRNDVIHIHWPSFLYYHEESRLETAIGLSRLFVLLLLLRMRGSLVAWTAHNLYPHDGGREVLAHRFARRFITRLASLVCVHGSAAAKAVATEFSVRPGKMLQVQHGHWIGYYPNTISREDARRRIGVPLEPHLFLFIGQCRPYKNLETLCRGFSALSGNQHLRIVGLFQDKAYLTRIQAVAADLAPRIVIEDRFVPDEELQIYLNACDAVVTPYKEILTSGTAMLAMSFGRPVVAPAVGSLSEVVTRDCGELYDPARAGDFERAMTSVLERRFDSGAILERAATFDWHASAIKYRTAIEALR